MTGDVDQSFPLGLGRPPKHTWDLLRDVDDDELFLPTGDFYDEGEWVVLDHFGWHLTHASRHLGMIEALKGVLGVEGTATV